MGNTPLLATKEVNTVQPPQPYPKRKQTKVIPFEVWNFFGMFDEDCLRILEEEEKKGAFCVYERDTSRDDDIEDLIDHFKPGQRPVFEQMFAASIRSQL
mgnify:CR=1 FL=1